MKGDFSRDTFDRRHRFARVLMQQGRVLLDADWNEQTSILLHNLRTLAADLIGLHGGPGDGFEILTEDENGDALENDFVIGWGHYYVGGILCENDDPRRRCSTGGAREAGETRGLRYTDQPDYPFPEDAEDYDLQKNTSYLVYLDVWERHLTHLEAEPIREVALGGPDTATRARVVWQVRVAPIDYDNPDEECAELFDRLVSKPHAEGRPPCLAARARVEEPSDDPCIIPPEARYRRDENQLYRVEIHDRGAAQDGWGGATFKWSRDNGSVVFGVRSLEGSTVELDSLGPDERRSLKPGDWVEIVDDHSVLRFEPRPLAKVESVDRAAYTVTLSPGSGLPELDEKSSTHPLLRRWDQGSDALPVEEGKWLDLEDGVQVRFTNDGTYATGDYWMIPARTATGDVLWPADRGRDGEPRPRARSPHGIEHHYAPLARLEVGDGGEVKKRPDGSDCRCTFTPPCARSRREIWERAEPLERERLDEPPPAETPRAGDVDGVGKEFARRLEEAGIEDAAAVARMTPSQLSKVLTPPGGRKVAEARATSIIEEAKRMLG